MTPNFYLGPKTKYFQPVVIEEYNGWPVIIINADSWYNRLSFGIKKAKLYIENIGIIKSFLETTKSRALMTGYEELAICGDLKIQRLTYQQAKLIDQFQPDIEKFVNSGGAYAGI